MSELLNVFENLKEKLDNSNDFLDKITNIYNNKVTNSNLKLLSDISSNINLLELQLDELYHYMLEISENEQTAEEISRLKSFKINNKIQEKIIPFMLYMKLVMENNVDNI